MPVESVRYKVADLSLAAYGRTEIRLAEHEMPGLMAVRAEDVPAPAPRGGRVRPGPAAAWGADHRIAAHDHPDGGPDRDAGGAGRGGALGELQHLLDPGSCGGRGGGGPGRDAGGSSGHPGVRLEGGEPAGVLVVR